MSASLDNNNRLKCVLCENYATATCDAYDTKRKDICRLPICHLHKKKTFGMDCCEKHYRSERARQSQHALDSQLSLF